MAGRVQTWFNRGMNKAHTAALFAATLCAGIFAGFFLTYAHTIMPGLGATDDRTFVGAFQAIDRAVADPGDGRAVNWVVVLTYIGGPLLTAVAIALNRSRPVVWWVVAALVLLIATIVLTETFNVPLNNAIKAAGDSNVIDVTQVRADFRESWWQAWNLLRCVTSTAAFGCLAWALVLRGRSS